MNISQNEMILDLDTFDFTDIDDSDIQEAVGKGAEEKYEQPKEFDFDEINEDDEEFLFDDEDEEVEQEDDDLPVEGFEDITEALGKLDTIPDSYELNFGNTKVNKGELVNLLNTREEVLQTREAINTFAQRLVEKENVINASFEVAKTETDKQLEHVYSMLNNPDKWNSATDVAQLQRARIQLEARKRELDTKNSEAKAAIDEQRQQAMVFNLQKVVKEMGSDAPIKSAAKYAESKGMNLDGLVQNLTPSLVEALNNAAKYEEFVNKNKSRLEKASKANRVRSRGARTQASEKKAPDVKARAWAAYKAGKMDNSQIFNFLED